jgi:hypothetical protein
MTKLISNKLVGELKAEIKKVNPDLSWFKFTEKSGLGWRFLPNKEIQWEKLEMIAKKISKKYPEYTTGQVVDELCRLVN